MKDLRPHLHRLAPYSTFIETGTAEGDTANSAQRWFSHVITIELHGELYANAVERFKNSNVLALFGSSRDVLPFLCGAIRHACVFFLDAHWYDAKGLVADHDPFPLWAELKAVRARRLRDVVIIDDAHLFGAISDLADWESVSEESILNTLGEGWGGERVENEFVASYEVTHA